MSRLKLVNRLVQSGDILTLIKVPKKTCVKGQQFLTYLDNRDGHQGEK